VDLPERAERSTILAAADRTLSVSSARFTLAMSYEGTAATLSGLADVAIEAEGAMDLVTGDAFMTMDMRALATAAEQSGNALPFGSDDLVFELRVVDGVAYVSMGPLAALAFGSDTEWIAFDTRRALADLGIDDQTLAQLRQQADPSMYVELLAAASGDVEVAGRGEVRGVPVTRYRATLDLGALAGAALGELPPELRDRVQGEGRDASLGALTELLGGVPVPIAVDVDDDGLARRVELRLPLGDLASAFGEAPPGTDGIDMVVAMELFGFGVAVDVEAPPASEVTDLTGLLEGAVGGTGREVPAA
jgi:hypothetical protein